MRTSMRFFMLAVLGAVLIAACGGGGDGDEPRKTADGSGPTPARSVNPGQRGPSASGNYSIEGALDVTGEYTVLYPFFDPKVDTCAEIASRAAERYVVPLPTFKDDQRFTWTAGLRQYNGPGTYGRRDLGGVSLEAREDADAEPMTFVARESSKVELSIKQDNSGSFRFTDLESTEGDKVSGKASWTCEEGSEGESED